MRIEFRPVCPEERRRLFNLLRPPADPPRDEAAERAIRSAPRHFAALAITAANVAPGAGATINKSYNAGAAIIQGKAVYLDTSTDPPTWKLADANDASATVRTVGGVAVNSASTGQPLAVQTGGPLTIGATVAAGSWYGLGATPGDIVPVADQVTGWYPSLIGYGISATQIQVQVVNTGVAVP
jgi:hypothetical protein